MNNRITSAFSKFIFCRKATANVFSFLRLLINTKRSKGTYNGTELPACYKIRFGELYEVYLRSHAGDIAVFYEIFWLKTYRVPGLNFQNFRVIVDAGANVGLSAMYFHLEAPSAIIYVIEPDPENFNVLEKNLRQINNFIIPIKAAVGNADEEVAIRTSHWAYNTTVGPVCGSSGGIESVSLNSLISRYNIHRIDLLKIDVEGYERIIFKKHLEWLQYVDNIIIELHSREDEEICLSSFRSNNFSIVQLPAPAKGLENLYWARNLNA